MMEEFQHILVPVDGSEPSVRALEKAVYLAEKCGSQVTLLTVVDMNKEINSFEQVSTGDYVPGELKEKGYQILLKLMPSIPKEIHVQAVVQIGDPAKNIVQYSEDHPPLRNVATGISGRTKGHQRHRPILYNPGI